MTPHQIIDRAMRLGALNARFNAWCLAARVARYACLVTSASTVAALVAGYRPGMLVSLACDVVASAVALTALVMTARILDNMRNP